MSLTICLVIFGAHVNILFLIKVKVLVLLKWSYRPSQLCQVLSLEWLVYFEHIVQSL